MGLRRRLGKSARVTLALTCSRTTIANAGSHSSSGAIKKSWRLARAVHATGGLSAMAEAVADLTTRLPSLVGQWPFAG